MPSNNYTYFYKYLDFARERKKQWSKEVTGKTIIVRGGRGVMVILAGNGHGDTSSNPG